ncbi:MAG: hypothetical protein OWQ54_05610 [Sulfolobaceae archaeon]|nr:hypothetical protein [Sulfolobaceae archaeon]
MALELLRRKKEEKVTKEAVDDVNILELPEEFLRIEYPEEWKYLQKVRNIGNYYYYF